MVIKKYYSHVIMYPFPMREQPVASFSRRTSVTVSKTEPTTEVISTPKGSRRAGVGRKPTTKEGLKTGPKQMSPEKGSTQPEKKKARSGPGLGSALDSAAQLSKSSPGGTS